MPRVRIDELIEERKKRRPKTTYYTVARAVLMGRGKMTEAAQYHALWRLNNGHRVRIDPGELMRIANHFGEYDIRRLLDVSEVKPVTEDDGA